jgi:transposase-like protein
MRINGWQMYLWRAIDDECEVLEVLIQRRRNKAAARNLIRKLLRKHGSAPTRVATDKLRSYGLRSRRSA